MSTGTPDQGPHPYVVDIEQATLDNTTYRTTIWTGAHLQATLMSIDPGEDIGLEVHPDNDQFLRLEQGRARCRMGPAHDDLPFDEEVRADWAVFVPAGTWHNIINTGAEPVRLYAIYGPRDHVPGTVHRTKRDQELDPTER
jgi:mannose-6-phosphate isomerase-like protein (cupin superfamily)